MFANLVILTVILEFTMNVPIRFGGKAFRCASRLMATVAWLLLLLVSASHLLEGGLSALVISSWSTVMLIAILWFSWERLFALDEPVGITALIDVWRRRRQA